jgi:DNA/RNA-binding domain of Phe-tRNA-synthetase-like protein
MRSLSVASEIFELLPGVEIVVVVGEGLDREGGGEAARELWSEAWAETGSRASEWPNAQSHPHVRPWREAWQRVGISAKKFPSSIEALLRRAMKGGEPFSIHPLVDLYNAVSLRHVVPVGALDLESIEGALDLRLSRVGDTFQALDDGEPLPVAPGEISWATGTTILTRHLVWRQSRQALIQPSTRTFVLVSEILPALPPGTALAVEESLRSGLAGCFGIESTAHRVRRGEPWVPL